MQLAMFLSGWKPRFPPLAEDVAQAVADYVGTRGRKYAEKTIAVKKKQKIFAQ